MAARPLRDGAKTKNRHKRRNRQDMKKEAQVIMLPTDKSHIAIVKKSGLPQLFDKEIIHSKNLQPHHFYIVDDSEIKENDWVIETSNNNLIAQFNEMSLNQRIMGCKKIIATTDPELKDVPQIPQVFIESYCKNPVDKVFVEYEPVCCKSYTSCNSNCSIKEWNLKLTSNNELSIHPIEEKLYAREEVELLCIKALRHEGYNVEFGRATDEANWIKENL